jgi:MFS superfamily sulfate permease-like transporter
MHVVRWVRPTLVSPIVAIVVGGILTWLFPLHYWRARFMTAPYSTVTDVDEFDFWNLMDFWRRLRTTTHLKQVK